MAKVFVEGLSQGPAGFTVTLDGKVTDYYNDMVGYNVPSQILSNVGEIAFYNMGGTSMIINGLLFPPGTGIGFDGKSKERDITKYTIQFQPYAGPIPPWAIANQNLAYVIRKVYMVEKVS